MISGCFDFNLAIPPYRSNIEVAEVTKNSDTDYNIRINYWINSNDNLYTPSDICSVSFYNKTEDNLIYSYSNSYTKYGTFWVNFKCIEKITDPVTESVTTKAIPIENVLVKVELGEYYFFSVPVSKLYKLSDFIK